MFESILQELYFKWELVEELASHVDRRTFKKNKQKALKENHNIVIKLTCVKMSYYAPEQNITLVSLITALHLSP